MSPMKARDGVLTIIGFIGSRDGALTIIAIGFIGWGVVKSDVALLVGGAGLLGTPGILSFNDDDDKDTD